MSTLLLPVTATWFAYFESNKKDNRFWEQLTPMQELEKEYESKCRDVNAMARALDANQ